MEVLSTATLALLRRPDVKAAIERLLSREVSEVAVAGVVLRRVD